MNLVRILKIKKLNGQLDNIPECDRQFIHLFDSLIEKNNKYFSINNQSTYFIIDKIENDTIIYCNFSNLKNIVVSNKNHHFTVLEFFNTIKILFKVYFNLDVLVGLC